MKKKDVFLKKCFCRERKTLHQKLSSYQVPFKYCDNRIGCYFRCLNCGKIS